MKMQFKRIMVALGVSAVLATTGVVVATPAQSATPGTLVGAWSKDWKWFDANVGPMQIYRYYDTGFHYATWQQTLAFAKHPDDPANPTHVDDYSVQLPPAQVADGTDDGQLSTFIASTPKNIVFTNYHEPEQEIEAGLFTFAQFQNSITHLAALVHAQNAIDGGTRVVSIVLMADTFVFDKGRNPNNYWPTSLPVVLNPITGLPVSENMPDLISADTYALPHATNTPGVPPGYTDGVKWNTGMAFLKPVLVWANAHHTKWGVSELGYLEDIHNPMRRANEIVAAYNYAAAGKVSPTTKVINQALFVEYWDSVGTRADWQLRYNSPPVPSTSNKSNAALAWKHLAGN